VEQTKLNFSQNTIHNINIYQEAAKQEALGVSGSSVTVQFTPTQKEAIHSICKEHNLKASSFIREMVDTYLELFPMIGKIKKHKDFLPVLLDKLS